MKEQSAAPAKRHFSKLLIIFTVIIQILLSIFISLMLVFHSPFFKTLEKFIISSAMESRTQQYIARLFLSDSQIKALLNSGNGTGVSQKLSGVTAKNTGDTKIQEYTVSGDQYTGYIIEVSDPLRVKVAMTQYVGKVGEFTSKIAERLNAAAAINGGGFQGGANWSDSAQNPTNFVFHDGKVIWQDQNWSDYKKVNTIALDGKGRLIVGNHSIEELRELNVTEAVTLPKNSENDFRPLIVNGEGEFTEGSSESRAPRTAIAQRKDGSILLIALDGRQIGQFGATYYELQQLLINNFSNSDNPVETATILDGGGSTTMYYNGEVINHPSAAFGERTVATAFYVEQ